MSKTTDKLIDDIIELILDDVDCHHEVDRDEDGAHVSVEYNLNNETKLRGMIGELIKKPRVTDEWINKKAKKMVEQFTLYPYSDSEYLKAKTLEAAKDFIYSIVEQIHGRKKD